MLHGPFASAGVTTLASKYNKWASNCSDPWTQTLSHAILMISSSTRLPNALHANNVCNIVWISRCMFWSEYMPFTRHLSTYQIGKVMMLFLFIKDGVSDEWHNWIYRAMHWMLKNRSMITQARFNFDSFQRNEMYGNEPMIWVKKNCWFIEFWIWQKILNIQVSTLGHL